MNPDARQVPPAQVAPTPGMIPNIPSPQGHPVASTHSDIKELSDQVKLLVRQYQNDPFALSRELELLKSAHIARQFHITINPAGS